MKAELVIYCNDLQRPSLIVDEIENSDGSKQLGNSVWNAVTFTLQSSEIFEIARQWTNVTIYSERCDEAWTFKDAWIAALSSTVGNTKYVMIFRSCHRRMKEAEP